MKPFCWAFAAVLMIWLPPGPLAAGSLEDSRAAYGRGDYKTTFELVLPLSVGGDVYAQGMLGRHYEAGEGVRQDQAEALKWYRKAADQGLAIAQYNVGVFYNFG